LSTESIASPAHVADVAESSCVACGASLAEDQRYCLECGERRTPMSSVLLGGPPSGSELSQAQGAATAPPAAPPGYGAAAADGAGRGNAVTVIAGVGVLLLAMGVGVLIGRSSAPKQSAAPAQVITVASAGAAGTGATAASSTAPSPFTGDWPAATNGYTVQLQTLPQSSTQVSAVEAAKTSATAKGAKSVGALKSEEFTSLSGSDYVIYSGVYHTKAEAQKALPALKKSFPGASVIEVSDGGSSSTSSSSSKSSPSSSSSGSSSDKGSGSSKSPPPATSSTPSSAGKSYEEKSKNLPDVVSTG
jgi:SPOR domain